MTVPFPQSGQGCPTSASPAGTAETGLLVAGGLPAAERLSGTERLSAAGRLSVAGRLSDAACSAFFAAGFRGALFFGSFFGLSAEAADVFPFLSGAGACMVMCRLLLSERTLNTISDTICFNSSRNCPALYVRFSISRNFFSQIPVSSADFSSSSWII